MHTLRMSEMLQKVQSQERILGNKNINNVKKCSLTRAKIKFRRLKLRHSPWGKKTHQHTKQKNRK